MADIETGKTIDNFKVPQLLPHTPSNSESVNDDENEKTNHENKPESKSEKSKKLTDIPLPYKEPSWSGPPATGFSLEIIKNGTFLELFPLRSSVVVFGRLDVCDIKFEHPSVSRFHAVIQYCSGNETIAPGFYLYDLGSTHGTFLNKDKISPKIYYKLKVGYILKFGGSTRLHIFQGPDEAEVVEEKTESSPVENVCTWGMGDDADEETDLTENPYALSTPNEDLYLDDPKKTLRGWFEREGYEVEYKVEEKGFKTFSCQVQLPIDTPTGDFMTVEASVSGKKKEAVAACALEACRTLDRLGLLRQSQHESRERKKKNWEENDYYDSDEDTFLDRTGTIEKKREKRMSSGKKPTIETFDSLTAKLKVVNDEISSITSKLSSDKSDAQSENKEEDDSLEAYMSTLSEGSDKASDKIERRKLKNRLAEAEKEKKHLEKLLEIATPSKLPPALKYPGMIGKRPKSKLTKVTPTIKEPIPTLDLKEDEEEVEEESDDETEKRSKKVDQADSKKEAKSVCEVPQKLDKVGTEQKSCNASSSKSLSFSQLDSFASEGKKSLAIKDKTEALGIAKEKKVSPTSAKEEKETSVVFQEEEEKPKAYGLILPKSKKPSNQASVKTTRMDDDTSDKPRPNPKRLKKASEDVKQNQDVYKTESEEYSTWVPPAGQSGDGMTHLNSKYGY